MGEWCEEDFNVSTTLMVVLNLQGGKGKGWGDCW